MNLKCVIATIPISLTWFTCLGLMLHLGAGVLIQPLIMSSSYFTSLPKLSFLLCLPPEAKERLEEMEGFAMEPAVPQKLASHQINQSILPCTWRATDGSRRWLLSPSGDGTAATWEWKAPQPMAIPGALWSSGCLLWLANGKGCWFAVYHQVA